MDIAILNYNTGEVDILRNIDMDLIDHEYHGEIEEYLDRIGYRTNDIEWMSCKNIIITES